MTFGGLHAKTQQIILRVFSPGIDNLQDELHAYCNLAGIQIISFPELSILLFFSKDYRDEILPCETRSMEAKGIFTKVKPVFNIDIMNTVHCLSQHISTNSESETDDEKETSQVTAKTPNSYENDEKQRVQHNPILKRKSTDPPEDAKVMRSYARHEPKLDIALLEMMTETSEEREYEEDNQLLNECKDDDEMYEMKGETLCNMTIPARRAVMNEGRNCGWQSDNTKRPRIIDYHGPDELGRKQNCCMRALNQAATRSTDLLRKSFRRITNQGED